MLARRTPSRAVLGLIVTVLVLVVHLAATTWMAQRLAPPQMAEPPPLEVSSLTRLMTVSAAPVVVAPPAPTAPPKAKQPAPAKPTGADAQAAQRPDPTPLPDATSPPEADTPQAKVAEVADEIEAELPQDPEPAPSEPATSVDVGSGQSATDQDLPARHVWPLATRVHYRLEGHHRGPVHGSATVEWRRQEDRYQVLIDARIGPRFAAIGSWRLLSEGRITSEGLVPDRFQQVDRIFIFTSAPRVVRFEAEEVTLHAGQRVPRLPGMQDGASQFIQMSHHFMVQGHRRQVGQLIDMPLALLNRAESVQYEVIDTVMLNTPLGDVNTLHVIPRLSGEQGVTLPAEIWFAPGLQYLPIRFLVRGKDSWMDLQMDEPPEQVLEADPDKGQPGEQGSAAPGVQQETVPLPLLLP